MGLKEGLKEIMTNREARVRTAEFAEKIKQEQIEFYEILKKLSNNSLDAGYNLILETPISVLKNAIRLIRDKNYSTKEFKKESLDLILGADGLNDDLGKVLISAVHLSGKSVKIGVRKLFGI